MKVVFPVEYAPRRSTIGLASKSPSFMDAPQKLENLYMSSIGLSFWKKMALRPSVMDVTTRMGTFRGSMVRLDVGICVCDNL